MQKLTLNVLLSLIIQSKVTGKGMTSNGRLFVMLMEIIADHNNKNLTSEENILNKFNNEVTHHDAYRKLERFLSRFIRTGQGYPYDLFSFEDFEDITKYNRFLHKMRSFVDIVIDESKRDSLVYTLLEIMRLDISITTIRYGMEDIPKERIIGSFAHPKKICIEALLLGLLYHVHKNPNAVECINLLEVDEKRVFRVVRYKNDFSLELNIPIDLMENIHENAKNQKSAEMKYQLELKCDSRTISEFPKTENVFIYGSGGAGKSTLLKSLLCDKNTINFYFPLYSYNFEIHKNFSSDSCYILLQILLKYHYQYEYQTYDALIANEGETAVLQQLTELEKMLISAPVSSKPSYTLLLDGINEMPSDMQISFISELESICSKWQNVRIIISGRIIPDYDVLRSIKHIEISGLSDTELECVLAENNIVLQSENLKEILKNSLFLNMYLDSKRDETPINTKGEILDNYFMNLKYTTPENSILTFLVKYALPFAVKDMFFIAFGTTLSRAKLLKAIDNAFDFYLLNEQVYQNFIAPKKYNKKALLECRAKTDLVELLINNTGLLQVSESMPHILNFAHQYYRDYFGARYVLNMIAAIEKAYEYNGAKKAEMYGEMGLTDVWYGGFSCCESDEVYRLIGEICGDYMNTNGNFRSTVLDTLIDSVRNYESYRTTENIIKTMSIVRNNVICDVDFSGLKLPVFMNDGISFSDNGKFPCSFSGCYVFDWNCYNLNFKNCDFTGAKFETAEYRNILYKQMAII